MRFSPYSTKIIFSSCYPSKEDLKIKKKDKIICLGHISADIFINRSSLQNLRVGGCIDSRELAIYAGGDVANVSFWLGKMATNVSMIGVIGDDPTGYFLKNELERVNVSSRLKISNQFPTASILIIIEADGERSFIINGMSQDDLTWEDIPQNKILEGNLFYTSAYTIENPPIKNTMIKLFPYLKQNKLNQLETMFNLAAYTTVENQKSELKSKFLPYTDILVGNREEFATLTDINKEVNDIDLLYVGEEVRNDFPNIEVILITDGKNGCYYITKDLKDHVSAPSITVKDTTGAGDGFCAGFIKKHLVGSDLKDAVKYGIQLGSQICQGYGARFGSSSFLYE